MPAIFGVPLLQLSGGWERLKVAAKWPAPAARHWSMICAATESAVPAMNSSSPIEKACAVGVSRIAGRSGRIESRVGFEKLAHVAALAVRPPQRRHGRRRAW